MKTVKPTNVKNRQDYFDQLAEPRKTEITQLDALIQKHAPKLEPHMQANMLAYGKYHYIYKSGREGDWFTLALASQKNYISVYCCITTNGKYLAEEYKKKLPKASIGKSCIRFKKIEDIDLKVLTEIIEKSQELHQPVIDLKNQ